MVTIIKQPKHHILKMFFKTNNYYSKLNAKFETQQAVEI